MKKNVKQAVALLTAAILLLGGLTGCKNADSEKTEADPEAYSLSNPAPMSTGSSYPGATHNEIVLSFLKKMFEGQLITVSDSATGGSYTFTSANNKSTYPDGVDYYLNPDIVSAIPDEWETELWVLVSDSMNFTSEQRCISFADDTGNYKLWFYTEAHFITVYNLNYYMTFQGDLGISGVAIDQFETLPTRTYNMRSPSETVSQFFDCLNKGDADGANALLLNPVANPTVTQGLADTILSVDDLGHIGNFPAEWCDKPYMNRVFLIKFKQKTSAGTQELKWDMYLVRATRDAEWKIAAYGVS